MIKKYPSREEMMKQHYGLNKTNYNSYQNVKLSVFISHSVGPVELPIVYHLSAALSGVGATPYLAINDRQAGVQLSAKLKEHIEESDVLLAVLTARGTDSAWVHEEIGYALGKGKKVLPFVEKGVEVKGMLQGVEAYIFDTSAPDMVIEKVAHDIALRAKSKEHARVKRQAEQAEIGIMVLLAVALSAILAWALLSRG
jgi:nucleoside 2-deoxyribosyltransferase